MGKKKLAENSAAEPAKRGRGPGRPFEKGTSPNPGGRPKEERDVVEALRLCGVELAEKLLELARAGNVKAIEVAFNRAYGKARERVEFDKPKGEIDFESMPPERAAKVGQLLEQLEALIGVDKLSITAEAGNEESQRLNYDLLSVDELRQFSALMKKATPPLKSERHPLFPSGRPKHSP